MSEDYYDSTTGYYPQQAQGSGSKSYGFLNDASNWLFGDPGAGQRQASQNIRNQVVPGFQQYGNQAWGQQMQGLQGALGAMDPSSQWFNNSYGSQGPGAMENAFQNFGNKFMNQGQTGQAAQGFGQYMQGSPMTYSAMNRAAGMAGSNVDYSGYQGQLNGAGGASQFWNQNQGQYGKPGAGENYWNQHANDFNRQTNSQGVYDNFSSQLYGPGQAESFRVQGPSWGTTDEKVSTAMGYASNAQAPTRLEGAQGAEAGNMYRNANNVNQFSRSAMPSLQNQGIYENFVQSDIMGNNPALEMERQEGAQALNHDLARRGGFRSGGADVALGKFQGTLAAKSYENRANRAQQAQGMELARLGEGRQLAQAGSGETMGQAAGLQGLAGQQDAQRFERQQFGANTALSAADKNIAQQNTNLQGQSLAMQAAMNADSSRNARLNTLQGMAGAGDQAWNSQQQLGMNAANQAQQQQLARLQGGFAGGQAADNSAYQRAMGQFNMGQSQDQQNLQRGQFQYQMGQGADANDLARYMQQAQIGNMADTQQQNQFINYMNAANQSQAAQSGRMRDAMGSMFNMGNANQGQFAPFYNQGGQMSGQMYEDAMNALANAYGLNAQGDAASGSSFMNALRTGIDGYAAYQTGGASTAAKKKG